MFDEEDRETGYALFLAIALAIFVSIFTIGIAAGTAIGQFGKKAPAGAAIPVATAAPAAAAAAAAPPAAERSVRLYFELGRAELPADALTQLAPLLGAAKEAAGAHWVISGYHDASGDAAANAELAKQRAFAVRDLLVSAGVAGSAIELSKPMVTMGGAEAREARRVEVTLR
jgi:outer membrane protein OmpA-like peptidoglycan-associated protein